MPLQEGDTYQATTRLLYAGSEDVQGRFTFNVMLMGDAEEGDILTLTAEVLDEMYGTLNVVMPPEYTYVSIGFNSISEGVSLGDVAWPTLEAGAGENNAMPSNATIDLTARTNRPKTLGHKKMPAAGEEQHVDSFWAGGAVSIISGLAGRYIAPIIDEVTGAIILAGVNHTTDIISEQFENFVTGVGKLVVGGLDSRKIGHGS